MRSIRCYCGLLGVAVLVASCATPPVRQRVADYEELPGTPATRIARSMGDRNQLFADKVFWGNYGGPGSLGGKPVDELDRAFYAHDRAYVDGWKLPELRKSDHLLIERLENMDPATLSPGAQAYRDRAIRYFKNPISRWLGKPANIILRTQRGPRVIWESEKQPNGS